MHTVADGLPTGVCGEAGVRAGGKGGRSTLSTPGPIACDPTRSGWDAQTPRSRAMHMACHVRIIAACCAAPATRATLWHAAPAGGCNFDVRIPVAKFSGSDRALLRQSWRAARHLRVEGRGAATAAPAAREPQPPFVRTFRTVTRKSSRLGRVAHVGTGIGPPRRHVRVAERRRSLLHKIGATRASATANGRLAFGAWPRSRRRRAPASTRGVTSTADPTKGVVEATIRRGWRVAISRRRRARPGRKWAGDEGL